MTWNAETIAQLKALLAQPCTYSQAARAMGCTRGAIAGAVRRHIHLEPYVRPKRPPPSTTINNQDWEAKLVEPWADRKARLEREANARKQG